MNIYNKGGRAGRLFNHVFPPMSKFNVTPKCKMSRIRGKFLNQGGPQCDCLFVLLPGSILSSNLARLFVALANVFLKIVS